MELHKVEKLLELIEHSMFMPYGPAGPDEDECKPVDALIDLLRHFIATHTGDRGAPVAYLRIAEQLARIELGIRRARAVTFGDFDPDVDPITKYWGD